MIPSILNPPQLLKKLAPGTERKPLRVILEDLRRCRSVNGTFPSHYFSRQLYHPDIPNPEDYIDEKTVRIVNRARYQQPARWLFDDKYHFSRHLARNGIPVPRLFGYSIGGFFYDEQRRIEIDSVERFRVLIFGLAGAAPNIFVKDLGGRMGQGVFRLTASSDESEIEEAFEVSKSRALIYEEEQRQHPALDEIYPGSFNTLRIINCMTGPERVETISAMLRFGTGGSYVDNSSRGGLFIGIDLESGRLRKLARRFFDMGGGRFERHPDTGFVFDGFEVPMLHQALRMAEDAMRAIPSPLVGWDVGITESGPVVVEGNAFADLFGAELADDGFRHNQVFRRFVDSLKSPAM